MSLAPARLAALPYLFVVLLNAFLWIASHPSSAQNVTSRIAGPVDDHLRTTLTGNVHPSAQPRFDRGRVSDSFPAQKMFLILQRSAERETALRQFLADVHTQGSPSYHKWLTPEKFGEAYGPSDEELSAVAAWLQQHGFSIARVTRGKTAVEFSGTAGQLREAFGTELHRYLVNGEAHYANASDPQIPAALAPVIAGLTPVNDFRPVPHLQMLGKVSFDPARHTLTPTWTTPFSSAYAFALAPGDFAVQYNLNPVYNSGINGTGVTIGIISAADVSDTVIANYQSFFGISFNLNRVIDTTAPTPGQGNWATEEAYLDVEVAGSVAPGATINLYTAADTAVQWGLLLAAERAVDDDAASVLSLSYGECERDLGTSGNQFWATLWEQAAAQGQTVLVSSGDGGSAGCDNFNAAEPASQGLAVSGFSSTPWNISVGGTDFYYSSYNGSANAQAAELAKYWSQTETYFPATSLLQPIPEQPWNRPFGLNLYDGGVYKPDVYGPMIVGGSGGASVLYAKPAWQSGKGVPPDQKRDLPDVSLFAAVTENSSFWPICVGWEDCIVQAGGSIGVTAVGGTSASTPAMAGIMALINQKYGPQGQANFVLYALAAQHPEVFHDVQVASNNVPCTSGTANCSLSSKNDNTKGFQTLAHYYSNAGYDEATGLGSVDANALIQNWNSLSFKPSSTTLNLNQTTFTHGTPVNLSVAVNGTGGTPSGDVGLVTTASPASNTTLEELTLAGGAGSTTLSNLPGGKYQITAKYTGDTIFAPSNSDPIALDVAPEASSVTVFGSYWSNDTNSFLPLANNGTYSYGTYMAFEAQPSGGSTGGGAATGTVTFTDTIGATTLNSGPVNLHQGGTAEWVPATTIPTGTNNLNVSYPGDGSYSTSSSAAPMTLSITKATPYAFLDSKPSPVAFGATTQLDFSVGAGYVSPLPSPPDSTYVYSSPLAPSETVTFSLGNTALATVNVIPNYNGYYGSEAILDVSTLPMGIDAVTASYSGDSNYNAASSTFNVVVLQTPALAAVSAPATLNEAEYTAITATITGVQGMATPTGQITFFAHGPGSDWSDTKTLSNGSATSSRLPGGLFMPGPASVDVSYTGDSVYGPGDTSSALTIVAGNTPPFAVITNAINISAGATTDNTSTITVSPQGGFTGTVYLTCTLTSSPPSAVHLPTCSIPASANIVDATPVTAVMTVNSTAPGTARSSHVADGGEHWGFLYAAIGIPGFFAIVVVPWRGRRQGRVLALLLVLMVLGMLPACGGGNNNNGGGGQPKLGTTPGNYTFTVKGSFTAGGVSQVEATVSVTVH